VNGDEDAKTIRELMSKTRAAVASGLPENLR
jgi:hypothetical protein